MITIIKYFLSFLILLFSTSTLEPTAQATTEAPLMQIPCGQDHFELSVEKGIENV